MSFRLLREEFALFHFAFTFELCFSKPDHSVLGDLLAFSSLWKPTSALSPSLVPGVEVEASWTFPAHVSMSVAVPVVPVELMFMQSCW